MVNPLQGRVALVTGASRGIGRAIAQRLASAGATVVVAARSLEAATGGGSLRETVALIEQAGGKAIAIAADLDNDGDTMSLPAEAARLAGGLDILVCNAGTATYAPLTELPVADLDRMARIYLRAPMLLARAAIPMFRTQGRGWIVNIGSITALPPALPASPGVQSGADVVYAALKAGLLRFTQGLAASLRTEGIAVNMVSPSTAIRTPGADALLPESYPTERVEYLAETVLAMRHLPVIERTGLAAFSMHYPWVADLTVHTLDGREALSRVEPPSWRYPTTPLRGDELNPAAVPVQ